MDNGDDHEINHIGAEPEEEDEVDYVVEEPEEDDDEAVENIDEEQQEENQVDPQLPDQEEVPENIDDDEEDQVDPHDQFEFEKNYVSEEDWDELFKKGKIKKEDMDMLVMDYLINHEFADAAETFHRESGCELSIDLSILRSEKTIKDLIFSRKFDEAINLINEKLGLSFLIDRPRILFHLEQQKLIELCRVRDNASAITFSHEFVRWKSFKIEDDDFEEECGRTLLVMAYGEDSESPAADLMEITRTLFLGLAVVDAIKDSQGPEKQSIPYRFSIASRLDCPGQFKKFNLIVRVVKCLTLLEEILNLIADFPNFNINTGYPERA